MPEGRNKISGGFTILELLISVSIIAVLAAMVLALSDTIRRRAEQAACVGNMRSLFAALSAYNTDYGHFPQAPENNDEQAFWDFWFETFEEEYDIPKKTWICPTYRRMNPGVEEENM